MAARKKDEPIAIQGHQLGWATDFSSQNVPVDGPEGSYKYSFGTSVVRPGKRGAIAPAEIFNNTSFTDAGSAFNTLPRAIDSDMNFTGARSAVMTGGGTSTAPKVISVDNTNAESSAHAITAPAGNFTTLPSTGFWGEDIVAYPAYADSVGTNADFYFYSYNTSTAGYIGRFDPTGPTFDDDFMATVPVGAATLQAGVPHRLCIGMDRLLYGTNGQYVAQYDSTTDQTGASGTFNATALFLGNNWVAVDVQPYPGYAVAIAMVKMGSTYQAPGYVSQARVVIWDGFSLEFNLSYEVNDYYIGSLKFIQGSLFAFTQGVEGTTKAKILDQNSASFKTVWAAPTSIVGAAPLPNQVEYFNEMIQWNGDTTTNMVFALAQTPKGEWALHTPYYLSSGSSTVTQSGFLKNVNSNILFAGVKGAAFGPGAGVMGAFGDGASNGSIITTLANGTIEFRTKIYYTGYQQTIRKIRVSFAKFGSDSSITIGLLAAKANYSVDGSNNIVGDKLSWTINTTTHPNVATTLTASTSEFGSRSIVATEISNFWLITRVTNTTVSQTPPMIDLVELFVEDTDQP